MSTIKARAQRLKDAREIRGFSQTDLAKAMGIARQTYIDMETAKTDISCSRLLELAQILNISPTYLLLGDECLQDNEALSNVKSLTNQLSDALAKLGVFPCLPPHNQTRT